ncbi:hypothetical protein BDN70DRAFT_824551 [Pholiota conissans]|uniref:GST N-terminal domain-containing protein n=1 Tax=Pholiota conissans TaxID=109636 RepID=A0A9P5ZCS5_9AGAR|nr:hypothetical protein BDN70DRAFT_824551 [Pholiota conissans]
MDASKPILFYDIASAPPATTYAPNPWKTRYALNFKGVQYKTEWVELPDVEATRKRLGVPAVRKIWDGSDFYTLPVIHDLATGEKIGDTFDIAVYLDKTYPNGPTLMPPSTAGLTKAFNLQIDTLFTNHVLLCAYGIPYNPANFEDTKKTFLYRARMEKWEDMKLEGEARVKTLESLKTALGELAKVYRTGGPFLEDAPAYPDLIVGAWLQFYKRTLLAKEWEDLTTWDNGLWAKIHKALEKYAEVK